MPLRSQGAWRGVDGAEERPWACAAGSQAVVRRNRRMAAVREKTELLCDHKIVTRGRQESALAGCSSKKRTTKGRQVARML